MKNTKNNQGEGHKANIKIDFIAKLEIDGKQVTDIKGSYDLSMQFESIEYAVQNLAGAVARVASKIAEPTVGPVATPVKASA